VGGGTLNKISPRKTYLNFRNNLTTLTKNHPGATLWLKILFRLVLDGIAGVKFLLDGEPKHFVAVIKAHFTFYSWIPSILKKRKWIKAHPHFKFSVSKTYNANIVAEHFLRKKNKFSDLSQSAFLD
jgi:hypothetical protein